MKGFVLILCSEAGPEEILVRDITHVLNSRMKKTPVFVEVGSRITMTSGLIRQNLIFAVVSLFWSSCTCFSSSCVRGRSISRSLAIFHIDSSVIFRYCNSCVDHPSASVMGFCVSS